MTPSIGKAVGEILRTIIITVVIARLIALLGGSDWKSAARLALWLWSGFSGMMWVGAIMWEQTLGKSPRSIRVTGSLKTILIASITSVASRNANTLTAATNARKGIGILRLSEKIALENVNRPGQVMRVDAHTYDAMKRAFLKILPKSAPGLTVAEIKNV